MMVIELELVQTNMAQNTTITVLKTVFYLSGN